MSIKSGSKKLSAGFDLQPGAPVVISENMVPEKQLLTAQELLTQVLDNVISYDQLLILTKKGQIPFVSLGGRRFYRRQTILTWLSNQEESSISIADDKASKPITLKGIKGGKIT